MPKSGLKLVMTTVSTRPSWRSASAAAVTSDGPLMRCCSAVTPCVVKPRSTAATLALLRIDTPADDKPADKPAPKAKSGSETKAGGNVAADGNGNASAGAGASVTAEASVER